MRQERIDAPASILFCVPASADAGFRAGGRAAGCAVFAGNYFACDTINAAHGRAPAVATAVKRLHPDQPVFTYQGDGDLASIGAAEIVHAAMRGEKFTTIFINNATYGMTGGQLAPTTLLGQRATTAKQGRKKELHGSPMRVAELLSTMDGCVYAERVCVTDIPHLNKAKAAIKKAFIKQLNGEGFTIPFIKRKETATPNGMTVSFGGEEGIRTLDTLMRYTRFPIVRARPTTRLLHVFALRKINIHFKLVDYNSTREESQAKFQKNLQPKESQEINVKILSLIRKFNLLAREKIGGFVY